MNHLVGYTLVTQAISHLVYLMSHGIIEPVRNYRIVSCIWESIKGNKKGGQPTCNKQYRYIWLSSEHLFWDSLLVEEKLN